MESQWFWFVLALLATWRVTHLISREDGPGDVLLKIRLRLGPGVLGQLMDCFNCLSLWVAAPFAWIVGRNVLEGVLAWLALSGGASLLERTSRDPVTIRELPDSDGEGDTDGMLWRETRGDTAADGTRANVGSSRFATSASGPTTATERTRSRENRPGTDS